MRLDSHSLSAAVFLVFVVFHESIAAKTVDTPRAVHVRGPHYDGLDTTTRLSLPWPDGGPRLIWKRKIGQGFSGFIVVGDRIFTQIQKRSGQYLACLELRTGRTIWQTRYDWPWQYKGNWPGPYATPTYVNGKLYFSGAQGLVGCADAYSGRLQWTRDIIGEFKGKGMYFGYAHTPLVEDGLVFVPAGATNAAVVALAAQDGRVVWKSGADSASYSSPIAITSGGQTQIVAFLEIATMGLDPKTGRQLWYNVWGSGYCAHGVWPLFSEPYLFRTVPFQRGCRTDKIVRKANGCELEPVWQNGEISGDFATPVIVDRKLFGFDVKSVQVDRKGQTPGDFVCLDLLTGKTCWRTNATGHAWGIACEDKLLLFNEHGTLIVAELSSLEYRELARAAILPGEVCWSMPTLKDGYLLVRGMEHAACFYLGDHPPPTDVGEITWQEGDNWLDRFQSKAMWAPSPADLGLWFGACLIGIFGMAWVLHLFFRSRVRRPILVFLAFSLPLAICGMPAYTILTGVFIFTWPAALFVSFLGVCMMGNMARENASVRSQTIARFALALFVLICAAYWAICRHLFIIAGWGFLAGFIAAAPQIYWLARKIFKEEDHIAQYLHLFLAFTVYFWVSALVIIYKTWKGIELLEI